MFPFNCLPRVTLLGKRTCLVVFLNLITVKTFIHYFYYFSGVATVIGTLAITGVAVYLVVVASHAIDYYGFTRTNRVQLIVGVLLLVVVLLLLVKFIRKRTSSSSTTVEKFFQEFTLRGKPTCLLLFVYFITV